MSQREIEAELRALQPVIEEMTGLKSRWNGVVHVMDAATMTLLKGRVAQAEKEWSCAIIVYDALAGNPARWRTLIHELLHSVSAGLNREYYQRFKGWEEAVVEQTQRILRPAVLQRLNVVVEDSAFVSYEAFWPYNECIAALEEIRQYVQTPAELFYPNLLRVPLAQRLGYVGTLHEDAAFRRLVALTAGKMRR